MYLLRQQHYHFHLYYNGVLLEKPGGVANSAMREIRGIFPY